MGPAILQYVPRAVFALALTESLLSFVVVHMLQGLPDAAGHGAGALCNMVAASLAFAAGTVTLIMNGQALDAQLSRRSLLIGVPIAGLVALPLLSAIRTLFPDSDRQLASLPLVWAVWLAAIAALRIGLSTMTERTRTARRILIIGDAKRIDALSARLLRARRNVYEPLTRDGARRPSERLREPGAAAVVVGGATPPCAMAGLLDCKLRGVPVLTEQMFQERELGRIDLETLRPADIVFADGYTEGWLSGWLKRASDIAIATVLMIITLPLMLLTAIAIKADSHGPVFYRQQRVGRLGRTFTLYKFRSMTVDAEAGGPAWAQQADPRITRVGSFIRACRIDELPQLVNVLLGQMSLVGPRPERPHFVQQLTEAIPFYHERSYVKPGVTGWAQVNYPYGASVEDAREKLAYDLFYVKHRGLLLDMLILLATIRVVLLREGAR